ncbi:MAG: isoleucine--tRNA ligase [Planctomycetota bacterium]|nr:isoleucine--tRNA ligase [Planctomycetota bacterium]
MFEAVDPRADFPAMEESILRFWKERDIFGKTLRTNEGGPIFRFYEGPPTANGRPHPGHVLTRVIKDLFPRYKTMCGFHVPRKAGWDTHGLPVEIEVEKELGLEKKDDILRYGVEPFVRKCMDSVFRYTAEWERLTERIAFWLDLGDAYVTYHKSYVESVWWAIAELWKKGLLYRGHKVVPWCPRCGTALSSHEVGLGYREVEDPSIYVGFRSAEDPRTYYLAWTTTPWTLISNAALTVDPEVDYVYARVGDERLVMAEARVGPVMGKMKFQVEGRVRGRELLGRSYEPLYPYARTDRKAYFIIAGDFVTLDSGTGIVHTAPAFGADDYRVGRENGLPVIQLVDPAGRFTPEVAPWAGRFCKDCDGEIIRDLQRRKLLLRRETVRHEYPHCWRCDGPLLYYARDSWFLATTKVIGRIIGNNRLIRWRPEHIRDGRFGNFLETNVDWALSRERYWGTPLPVWMCERCGDWEAIASMDDLRSRPGARGFDVFEKAREKEPDLSPHLAIHKPYIDAVTYDCQRCGGRSSRVTEVIDCWFDSGAMPFAQWGYPHVPGSREKFEACFPADFIAEAIDQTRGWFYSLLAISTMVFDKAEMPHPFRNCIVLGHVLNSEGEKLSKSKRNYTEPSELIARVGADALRWYFYSSNQPWTSTRFDDRAVAEAQREYIVKLWNVYSFFAIYARIDGFDPSEGAGQVRCFLSSEFAGARGYRPARERSLLDRWIISETNLAVRELRRALDDFDCYGAARVLLELCDSLSNWYVRRSRARFWKGEKDADKYDAYWTLYESLLTMVRMTAPFTPFLAEEMYRNLARSPWPSSVPESVHMCTFPEADESAIDEALSREMALVREIVRLGRAARTAAKLKVRQPLRLAEIVLANPADRETVRKHMALIADELNVKEIRYNDDIVPTQHASYAIRPNFKAIGPKHGALVPKIKAALEKADARAAYGEMARTGRLILDLPEKVELSPSEVEVVVEAREGYAASDSRRAVVVLDTGLDEDLIEEGLAREIVNRVNSLRSEMDLSYDARIRLTISGSDRVVSVCNRFADYIKGETLAVSLSTGPVPQGVATSEADLGGESAILCVSRA